jgi:putative FmdB family regulatory protein
MPIYEFICQECRNIFELLALSSGDLIEIKCPNCNSENLERVMSKVNVVSGSSSKNSPNPIVNRSCASGSCSTLTLPGYTKD